jgi:hypothetical protein
MTLLDAIIIYLALGAPFAVYDFLQNRKRPATQKWISAAFAFIFWIPLAVRVLHRELKVHGYAREFDAQRDEKIRVIGDALKDLLMANGSTISVFNYRDVFDRYVGLTLATRRENTNSHSNDTELFEIAGCLNTELAAKCLNRRNSIRLERHQTEARRNFLMMIEMSLTENADAAGKALELAELLDDEPAISRLRKMELRAGGNGTNRSESDIWNSGRQKTQSKSATPRLSKLATASKND